MSEYTPFMPTVILTDSQQKQLKAAQIRAKKPAYTPEDLERAGEDADRSGAIGLGDMHRAGAQAMRELAEFKSGVVWQLALSHRNENAKLEARVKVLEEALIPIRDDDKVPAFIRTIARAALQVKP